MAEARRQAGRKTHVLKGPPAPNSQPILLIALLVIGLGNLFVPTVVNAALPIDYLLIALAICSASILFHLKAVLSKINLLWPGIVFVLCCAPGFLSHSLTAYGLTKAQAVLVILIIFLASATIRHMLAFVTRFAVAAIVACTLFALAAQQFGTTDVGGRLVFLGLNPIGIGRAGGLALVLALGLVITRQARRPLTVLALLTVMAVNAALIVATGSRGPLVSAAVGVFALLALLAATRQITIRTTLLIVVSSIALVGVVLLSSSTGLTRLTNATDSGRITLYSDTLRLALDHPLGIGWGELGRYIVDFRAIDEESLYAHNAFLEIFVEGGLIALAGFTVLVLIALKRALSAVKFDTRLVAVYVVAVYALASAQFSSDIVGNRLMWLSLGLALVTVPRSDADDIQAAPAMTNSRVLKQLRPGLKARRG